MHAARRILQRITTLLPSRAITHSVGRQLTLNLQYPLRNHPTIGGVFGCGRGISGGDTATLNSMADSEQQPLQEPPDKKSSCTEAVGASEEEKEKAELSENAQDENQKMEGSGSVASKDGDTDDQGGSDVDPAKVATEAGKDVDRHVGSNDAAETISDEAGMKKDEVNVDTVTVDEHRPVVVAEQSRDKNDKTSPPEEEVVDPPRGQGQRLSAAGANNPPKQGEGGGGGIRGFFMRRFFSHEPRRDRKYYESLSLEEKRKLYTCGRDFLTLDEIETWEEFRKKLKPSKNKPPQSEYPHNPVLNEKVSLWRGDITKLEIDAIVNAANSSLLGGGGVDGAIHRAAGYSLKEECATLNGCETGDAKITSGHRLPAKYVLHTVGPINGSETKLRSCYEHCLQLVLENDIRSVAFCCIATGVYGYPNEDAAHVALETTRKWLESHADKVDRIIFCVFLKNDYKIYGELLHHYFPPEEPVAKEREEEPVAREGEEGAAAESEAMETQDGGSPTAATDGKDIAEEPSNNDEFVIVDIDIPPVPTLQKSITEPAQRVPSKPGSDEKTEPLDPEPPIEYSKDEAGDDGAAASDSTALAGAAGEEEGMEVDNEDTSPNKRAKME